jgi:predicted amidohydrolase
LLKAAVIQHRFRANERMDLAALLASAQRASDEGAGVVVCPCIPGLRQNTRVFQAFIENMRAYAPGSLLVSTCIAFACEEDGPRLSATPFGRTLVLAGDECVDPALYGTIAGLAPEAMVWQFDPASALEAEALLETALDTSLVLAGLVVITSTVGGARGFGGTAVVHLGEIVAEAGEGDDTITAELHVPVALPGRRGPLPVLPPILAQRLAVNAGGRAPVPYPAELP